MLLVGFLRLWPRKTLWLVTLLLALGIVFLAGCQKAEEEVLVPVDEETPVEETPLEEPVEEMPLSDEVINPLTGKMVDKDKIERRPFGVLIDNNPEGGMQYGLLEADLVYEVLVEGGITRFLALYLEGEPDIIGPVRSVRHYYLDWVMEWDAVVAHVGGSPRAQNEIRQLGLNDLDDLSGVDAFWLDKSKKRPYSTFTSHDLVRSIMEKKDWERDSLVESRWEFSEASPRGTQRARDVTIQYTGWLGHTVTYKYSQAMNTYFRYENGDAHKDPLTGIHLRADNIVIQFVETWPIPNDSEGRLDMKLVGEGKAIYISQGMLEEGTWSKASRDEPTVYLGADGKTVKLLPGQTWINVVPKGTVVDIR